MQLRPNYCLKYSKFKNKHNTLLNEESKGNKACTVKCENKIFPHSSENKNCQSNKEYGSESPSHEL